MAELLAVQGSPTDIGGYYRPDDAMAEAVMRPSATFNDGPGHAWAEPPTGLPVAVGPLPSSSSRSGRNSRSTALSVRSSARR